MKKAYSAPRLTVHGDIATVTRIGGDWLTDVVGALPTFF
jgi:hypothetical protein